MIALTSDGTLIAVFDDWKALSNELDLKYGKNNISINNGYVKIYRLSALLPVYKSWFTDYYAYEVLYNELPS